jgi:hypothetical protein
LSFDGFCLSVAGEQQSELQQERPGFLALSSFGTGVFGAGDEQQKELQQG